MTSRGIWKLSAAFAVLMLFAAPASAATISVNTTLDGVVNDANCTIREALNAARTNTAANGCVAGQTGAVDTISLDASGTYLLDGAANEDLNATGDLDVFASPGADAGLIIEGDPGPSASDTQDKIEPTGLDRVLDIPSGGPVTLDTVTIQDGNLAFDEFSIGGGVQQLASSPTLTITKSVFRNNQAGGGGGGIAALGHLTITDSLVGGSTALDANRARVGGGISASGGLTMLRTLVQNNVATLAANGVFNLSSGGGLSMSGGTATITDSTFLSNAATAVETVDGVQAGAISSENVNLAMNGTTVSGNSLNGGTNANGAGVRVSGANPFTAAIRNSTLSGNSVGAGPGSRSTSAVVLTATSGTLALIQSTITGNTSPDNIAISGGGSTSARGTLINQGSSGCFSPLIANSYNADAGTSCVGATDDTDIENAAALALGGLLSNGGPTATHAIGPTGTDLLDKVPAADCLDAAGGSPLLVDQRGAERPTGSACDIGAYERVTCNGALPNVLGGPGNDTLTGFNVFPDTMVGSAGNDTMDGVILNDNVCGGSGGDTLTGGTGQDMIFGETGNDTIHALDGAADTVDCGPGTDSYDADAGMDTLIGCETDVNAPPGAGGGGGTVTPPAKKKKCKKGRKLKKGKCVKKKRKKK